MNSIAFKSADMTLPRSYRTFARKLLFMLVFSIMILTILYHTEHSSLGAFLPEKVMQPYLSVVPSACDSSNLLNNRNDKNILLINSTNFKIPDFPPWSSAAKTLLEKRCTNFFKGDQKCAEKHIHSWAYINQSTININLTAVKVSGYTWNSIICSYRTIIRVEQTLKNSDMNTDKVIRYSDKCHPIRHPTQYVDTEFIRLHCISTSQPTFGDVVSRDFLAAAKPDDKALVRMKAWKESWKKNPAQNSPPNVIILGVDTMSRLNAYRNFNKTLRVLQQIGAIEMKGYTKVGGNTFPNTVGILAGNTISDMMRYCYRNVQVPMNNCTYLFKPFNKVGYLTTTMEDAVLGTSFNYFKKGFVEKPVDFYLRPLMLAVMRYQFRPLRSYMRCLGGQQIEKFILKFLEDILNLPAPTNSPLFAHVWLTSLSHECGTSPKYVDQIFANHIEKVISTYNNTILIFLCDHGETYAEFRETVQGWYEDNLSMSWIYLPLHIRHSFPDWYHALKVNSNRLTSHIDLYKTLVHLLKTFDKDNLAHDTYKRQQRGQSLFEPVDEDRTCEKAGIPDGFCVCSEPQDANLNNPLIVKSVQIAIEYIKSLLPNVCKQSTFKEIKKAKSFKHPSLYMVYIVTFVTNLGDFVFEATVKKKSPEDKELVIANDVLRINKMDRKADCVSDSLLEKYCYCS